MSLIRLIYIGGGGNQHVPGIPARDIAVTTDEDEGADIALTALQVRQLVIRMKGESPVLDEWGKETPTGLYEYADTAEPEPATPRKRRGG